MRDCLRANRERMIEPLPGLSRASPTWPTGCRRTRRRMGYASNQFLVDLLVWYHLAWIGETVRRSDPRVQQLQDKARGFSAARPARAARASCSSCCGRSCRATGALAERGQVELRDDALRAPDPAAAARLRVGARGQPEAHLPLTRRTIPGGRERARWHLQHGLATCSSACFGIAAGGLLAVGGRGQRCGAGAARPRRAFAGRRAASSVLRNSIGADGQRPHDRRAAAIASTASPRAAVDCFFRDDGLSDLIGFTYSEWHADDAVANLVAPHGEHRGSLRGPPRLR